METKISVRSDLLKIAEDLKAISKAAEDTAKSLDDATKEVGKGVNDQVAVVNGGMQKIRKFGKDLVKQLGSDFKGLFAVNAMASGLKLNEQFAGSIKQAVNLNDTIRNLAPVFGMNESAAEKFKRTMVKSLSEIGVGADAAANALAGLAETNVRGNDNLTAYAKTSSELAGISKQKGQEGTIAKGLSSVVVAQGGNPNDPRAMQKVAEDIVRIRNATGKSATEALATMEKLFSSANTDFKKKLLQGGGVSLAAAGLIGGQGSTAFLERFMGMSKQGRSGFEAQGLGRLIGANGQLNPAAFQKTMAEAKGRGSGNAEFGLQTMGMSDDEAKGFVRLANALKENGAAVEAARSAVVDINDEYRKTMSLGDSFQANINKVKGGLTALMDKAGLPDLINKGTNLLGKASQSTGGAAAVVGGGALLAAMLTSRGIGGIGGLLGGELKAKAIEGVTGEKVQRVEVINWPAGMGIGGIGGAAGSGILGTASKVIGAAGLAYAAGSATANVLESHPIGPSGSSEYDAVKKVGGENAAAIYEKISNVLVMMNNKLFGTNFPTLQQSRDVRVVVDSKDKSLKAYQPASRGASQ